MNPRGIPIAQVDSNTELDSKLQRIARTVPASDYYAAFGAYMSIVLKAWATASRDADEDLLAMIPADVLERLVGVGLVEPDGRLPEDVFERRIASVVVERNDRRDRLAEIAVAGGKARAARAGRDAVGRLLPAGASHQPATSQPEPAYTAGPSSRLAGPSSLEERRGEERNNTAPDVANAPSGAGALAAFAAPGATRSDRQWVEYVVEHGVGSRGRMTRLAEFYAARFGRPFPEDSFPRLAKAVKVHAGGLPGLMADLSEAALRGVAGDPLDWVAGKMRRSYGESRRPASAGLAPLGSYDAIAQSGD